jgi:hypothetical protein
VSDESLVFTTESGDRVFLPGAVLPVGTVVMARDGSVEKVKFPGTQVNPWQPYPLVEVRLPDYDRRWKEVHIRLGLREGRLK